MSSSPSLPSMLYSTAAYTAATAIVLTLSWLFTSLRCYVRARFLHAFCWDDVLALLALIAFTTSSALFLASIHQRFGHDDAASLAADASEATKLLFFAELTFILGSGLIKISFALTLYRIVEARLHIFSLYVISAITVAMTVITFFFMLCTCKPISQYWSQYRDMNGGTCKDYVVQIDESYAHGATMLFVDIALGIAIPIHLLWGLQMQFKLKALAGAVLAMGSLASVATIARITYTSTLHQHHHDNSLVSIFWTEMELAISIVCTAASTLKPLLVALGALTTSNGQFSDSRRSFPPPSSVRLIEIESHVKQ